MAKKPADRYRLALCDTETDLPDSDILDGDFAITKDKGKFLWANNGGWIDFVSACWPIGSVFLLIPDTNPSELLGFGTWIEVQQDKLPVHIWRRTA